MSETAAPTKVTKAKPEVTEVTIKDGRTVAFVGKRNLNKNYAEDAAAGTVTSTFDFRTGDTFSFTCGTDDLPMLLRLAGHGTVQKAGDKAKVKALANGEPDVDSQVIAVEDILTRLSDTSKSLDERWFAEAAAGDGFSGASVVIKAIMEVSGLTAEKVKAFLEKKLTDSAEATKANGGKALTRQALYAGYRNNKQSKIGQAIERLEQEKLAASAGDVDADADLAAMKEAA